MEVTVDLSGLDEFVEEVEEYANELMKEAAHNAVDTQKERNVSSKKTYQNHTWNLRNAPGAAVVRNGNIVYLYVPADSEHAGAKGKTENLLIYGKLPKTVLCSPMEWSMRALFLARVLTFWIRQA